MLHSRSNQQGFLHGAIILTASTALVKILGFLFTVPMINLMGAEGMGYYYTAYEVYALFAVLFTSGLPVAAVKLVSRFAAAGDERKTNQIFRVTRWTFDVLGFLCAASMLLFSEAIASVLHNNSAALSIAALSPLVLCSAVLSAYRSYFQGRANMFPTAMTEILEAVLKLVLGVGIVFIMKKLGCDNVHAAAGAVTGITLSGAAAIVLIRLYKRQDVHCSEMTNTGAMDILKALGAMAIPVTLSALLFQVIGILDTRIIMQRLQDTLGMSEYNANWLYGVYGNAKKIFNLPLVLVVPFSTSVIPAISAAGAKKETDRTCALILQSLKMTMLFAFPAGTGLLILSHPIMSLIYFKASHEIDMGAPLLSILGIAVICNSLAMITASILQSADRMTYPAATMLAGGIVKIVSCWFLVGNPHLGILGAPISTCLCYGATALCNLIRICRKLIRPRRLLQCAGKAAVCTGIMAAAVYVLNWGIAALLPAKAACVLAMATGAVLYAVLSARTGLITREDLNQIPKGRQIANLLHLK